MTHRPAEAIRSNFNTLNLHDARLLGLQVYRREDGAGDDVRVALQLMRERYPEPAWQDAQIRLIDCTYVKASLDLSGKFLCNDAVFSAICHDESALRAELERDRMKDEDRRMDEYLHFAFYLCPPGGELHVFARGFEFRSNDLGGPFP